MAIRTANAEWKGDLRAATGRSAARPASSAARTRSSRGSPTAGGTNPEELIAAAQAACYSMQLAQAHEGGTKAESISTEAKVQILKQGDGFAITKIDLVTVGRVPGIDDAGFQETARSAKENCLISKALGAVPEINLDARLES